MKKLLLVTFGCLLAVYVSGQPIPAFTAYTIPVVGAGNEENATGSASNSFSICESFQVLSPIKVTQLGMFDSNGDGIQGSAIISIQLYQQNGGKLNALLLESVAFDAANSGSLVGGYRFKSLDHPVILLPGKYLLTANGFDAMNLEYNTAKSSANAVVPQVVLNDGGGMIRFLGLYNRLHNGGPVIRTPAKDMGSPTQYAAGTFVYSPVSLPTVPYAADYAALTAGVTNYPMDITRSHFYVYGDRIVPNRFGSIAAIESGAFPVLVEPSGSRLIFEAAGTYNNDPDSARCVAFSKEQWAHSPNDTRAVLFENAVRWASRKSNPADIVIGLTTNLDAGYFLFRGYHVKTLDGVTLDINALSDCDVVVADFDSGQYNAAFIQQISTFNALGGGLVVEFLPWSFVHGTILEPFPTVNSLVNPFGLAYCPTQTQPVDFGFTNVQAIPYPDYFSAFPAANLLYQDRLGQIQLDSLARLTSLHTIAYASTVSPDLLAALMEVYAGTTNSAVSTAAGGGVNGFADTVVMSGSQADANRLGEWQEETNGDLTAQNCRGSVEYTFTVPAADVYQVQINGVQNLPYSSLTNFDLILSVDGVALGHHNLAARGRTSGTVKCLTPYLAAGQHSLKIFWDNSESYTQLRLQTVRVQTGFGPDSSGSGMKDWVAALINDQSGLDITNSTITSYASPACLEGRDPYLSLMSLNVGGSDANAADAITPQPTAAGRWYANVPLANGGDTILNVSYQNGAKMETRRLKWQVVNVMQGGSFTIRIGDRMAFTVLPTGASVGTMQFVIGTNQIALPNGSEQIIQTFEDAGEFVVKGTYTASDGISQSGSVSVKVVGYKIANQPDCWVGMDREWDMPKPPSEAVQNADPQLFLEPIALLPDGSEDMDLLTARNEPLYLVTRLGTGGPILNATAAKGFNLWSGIDTYTKVIESYSDGSELVEMLLVMSPVMPDVTVELDVIVGGVVFDDGTTTKVLSASDFDALGQYKVRFVRPASAKTSVCHSITVYQGDSLVGTRR